MIFFRMLEMGNLIIYYVSIKDKLYIKNFVRICQELVFNNKNFLGENCLKIVRGKCMSV